MSDTLCGLGISCNRRKEYHHQVSQSLQHNKKSYIIPVSSLVVQLHSLLPLLSIQLKYKRFKSIRCGSKADLSIILITDQATYL